MGTIRWRLALGYAVALVLSLAAFGAAVYYELRQPSAADIDQRLALERDFAANYLSDSYRILGTLVLPDSFPTLAPSVASSFQAFRDYLIVTDSTGHKLFVSDSAAALPFDALQRLMEPMARPLATPFQGNVAAIVDLGPPAGAVRVLATPLRSAGPEIGGLLVAAPLSRLTPDARVFLRAALLIAPLVAVASVFVGFWLAGRALKPVEGIMDEVEAITDGRSLHRRLAVLNSHDEIARLGQTLNGMLARLETSFTSLHRFTADAGHELKTPLMVLRAGVERALTHPRTPREVLQTLDETLQEINRMSEMVESLLTLARADEGRAPLAVERCDLRELVSEASETAGMLGESAGIVVTNSMPAEPVWVEADRRRLREMLLNLVTNAIKYTPAGGRVELGLAERGSVVEVMVRDSGIGIAAGDLPHIFERFWRADAARSRTGERPGAGLGLAITKWIVEVHGGTIAVKSRPGRGTTVTVRLPRPGTEGPESQKFVTAVDMGEDGEDG